MVCGVQKKERHNNIIAQDIMPAYVLGEAVLRSVENNDPDVTGLTVAWNSWIERAGQVIGDSKSLNNLDITIRSNDLKEIWLEDLLQHLQRNRSIEHLVIYFEKIQISDDKTPEEEDCDIFQVLTPFLEENSNLDHITIHEGSKCMIRSLSLALLSCQNKLLRSISLHNIETGWDVRQFFCSLTEYVSLEYISIRGSCLGTEGSKALSKLIQSPSSVIHCLELVDNTFDEDCFSIICDGLVKNSSIGFLNFGMNSIPAAGWSVFSTVLSRRFFEVLWLDDTGMDNEGATVLGDALAGYCLLYLDLSCNQAITLEGWQGFFNCLNSPNLALNTLNLEYCNINDEGVALIMNALEGYVPMERLFLDSNVITSRGLRTILNSLLTCEISLRQLQLTENNIDFGDLAVEEVLLLSRTLCDKSTIESTYYSTHICCAINFGVINVGDFDDNVDELWHDIQSSLGVDARDKIMKHHFPGRDTDLSAFASMPETVLPYAIEWIGRDSLGRSLMYQFVGGFPTLFEARNRSITSGTEKKRKYQSHLLAE